MIIEANMTSYNFGLADVAAQWVGGLAAMVEMFVKSMLTRSRDNDF